MSIRPHGFNILVKPDPPPSRGSGLIVAPDAYDAETYSSGTVIAVGDGSQARFQARQKAIQQCLDVVREMEMTFNYPAALQVTREDIARLLGTAPEATVRVGQRVIFSPTDYLETHVNDETMLVMSEDALLGVYDNEGVAA